MNFMLSFPAEAFKNSKRPSKDENCAKKQKPSFAEKFSEIFNELGSCSSHSQKRKIIEMKGLIEGMSESEQTTVISRALDD
ncbi:uncharacterized protein MONOS_18097 [Monocercomonoides exilis]|uniref:uncharacterized protein n=1 Tax=Monocercomonoides exilis TaxID=2049356 RepID=UPI00355A0468|nr:hypothetical protein MONOS_18097 [Monocercomonoides exilis]